MNRRVRRRGTADTDRSRPMLTLEVGRRPADHGLYFDSCCLGCGYHVCSCPAEPPNRLFDADTVRRCVLTPGQVPCDCWDPAHTEGPLWECRRCGMLLVAEQAADEPTAPWEHVGDGWWDHPSGACISLDRDGRWDWRTEEGDWQLLVGDRKAAWQAAAAAALGVSS